MNDRSSVRLAVAVSALLIGFQVAGRATRDALFLSHFPVTSLPRMMAAAAVLSLLAALLASRALRRLGPAVLVPRLLAASATLQLGEWALMGVAPQLATVLVYLQFNAVGALLVSAFWSLINERFDPRTAKQAIGLIGTAGTVGGIAGGLFTERVGALLTVPAMLPVLALIHFACAAIVMRIREGPAPPPKEPLLPEATRTSARQRRAPGASGEAAGVQPGGFRALAASPYLRLLAAAILLGTVSEGLLDYVFKAAAKQTIDRGDELLRLFALFYTGTNLAGGVVSTTVGRRALEKLGLARSVGMLPWTVAVGGVGAMLIPGLPSALLARGAEATIRTSLYRSGWELLFAPLPPDEKRAAKPLLDVGAVRIGDMLAAGAVQLALLAMPARATSLMLALAVAAAAIGILLTWRIQRGYVTALEHSLLARAFELDLGDAVLDRSTRMTVARAGRELPQLRQSGVWSAVAEASAAAGFPESPTREFFTEEPAVARLIEMHAADLRRVRAALQNGPPAPLHVPRIIALLGNDDVSRAAGDALKLAAARHIGQLVDALLDPSSDVAVRRRIPDVITAAPSPRAIDGLIAGLHDPRFEVRVRCGRALVRMTSVDPRLQVDIPRVLAAILAEVAVDRNVWESQRVPGEDADDDPLQVGVALRERASRSLEHVFTVLSLILPRQPLQIAFQGLHTRDPQLRGTALEYLETALPPSVREKLWPFIGDRPFRSEGGRAREQVVAELVAARSSIMLDLEVLRRMEEKR